MSLNSLLKMLKEELYGKFKTVMIYCLKGLIKNSIILNNYCI